MKKYYFTTILLCLFWGTFYAQVQNYNRILVDSTNPKWGDYDEPDWLRYFGLDAYDVNKDGYQDVITGRSIFLNPKGNMDGEWQRIDLGHNVDAFIGMDVDGDEQADVIAMALPDLYWYKAVDGKANKWERTWIGQVPATSHVNSQGFEKIDLFPGGAMEFVIAGNGDVYLFEAIKIKGSISWERTLVAQNTSDEGIGVGDLDADGDIDLVTGRRASGQEEPTILVWFENPGIGQGLWKDTEMATTSHAIDRIAVADMNDDGKQDIIITEERYPGKEPDGNIFWFEQDSLTAGKWIKHHLATQYSTNNLDVKDMDGDGDMDIITSEHKGPDLKNQIWINDGSGNFQETWFDTGVEAHLGTKVLDMDLDGDLDIVSIGWDQYQKVHLWRNDALSGESTTWRHLSTTKNDLELPNVGNQQTASLIADVDQNGSQDFFITERTQAPSVVLYLHNGSGWDRLVVEKEPLRIEAGSASLDIDGDGDLDVVFGGESQSNEVWWWENPFPNFSPNVPWVRRTIKKSGGTKHHDQMFGDFDGDGKQELVFWNQGSTSLIMADIPANVKKTSAEWPMKTIYTYTTDSEMQPIVGLNGYPGWQTVNEHEGLAKMDMDGDGIMDIVGGGRWFQYRDGQFVPHLIDASYTFSRSAVGQLIEGGRPEVLMVVGDGVGPLFMYEWHEWEGWQGNKRGTGTWKRTQLLDELYNGHTLEILDFNKDGHLDIFSAEMRFGDENPDAKVRILLGNGKGQFTEKVIARGFGVHEGKMADLDGDGDFDVLGKPYTWQAPLINIWLNGGY